MGMDVQRRRNRGRHNKICERLYQREGTVEGGSTRGVRAHIREKGLSREEVHGV